MSCPCSHWCGSWSCSCSCYLFLLLFMFRWRCLFLFAVNVLFMLMVSHGYDGADDTHHNNDRKPTLFVFVFCYSIDQDSANSKLEPLRLSSKPQLILTVKPHIFWKVLWQHKTIQNQHVDKCAETIVEGGWFASRFVNGFLSSHACCNWISMIVGRFDSRDNNENNQWLINVPL